jgi:hypothetical protein
MSMVQTKVASKTGKKWWEQKAAAGTTPAIVKQTKSIQTITFNTSSFNDEDRTFVAIASTPVEDRYGDTIQQDGWDLENFLKNPVIPWAHDYWQPPVGRVVEIGINEQGNLQFKYQAPPEGIYPFADTVWNLYRNQFMFAFSVGFSSTESERAAKDEDDDDWGWGGGINFIKCQLLEISAVVVPANPQAVALALDSGVIDEVQLKDLKHQLADGIKNVDRLIAKQTKTVAKDAEDTSDDKKDNDDVKEDDTEVKVDDVTLTNDEAKALISAVNKAASRLEAATKAANAEDDKADGDAGANDVNDAEKDAGTDGDAKDLTTDASIDDTKGMETKAGASLSKANKDKLKSVQSDLTDFIGKAQAHLGTIGAMLGDDAEGEKEAVVDETKATGDKVQQKDGEAENADATDAAADTSATANGTNNDEQQHGDDNASKGDGEVNSEADKKADEGADQQATGDKKDDDKEADKATGDDELVDPENLTPEQAEKIAAAVNEELEKLKQ